MTIKTLLEPVKNPWESIDLSLDIKVAECDRAYLESLDLSKKQYRGLDLSLMPDPFCGNPHSWVYCLNMNPGEPGEIGRNFETDERYIELIKRNLRHEVDSCFWSKDLLANGKRHPGIDWMERYLGPMKKKYGEYPNPFFIEYFPYHSKQGFNFPENLPSNQYRDYLIKKAMLEGKLIVVMRMARKGKKGWYDIEGLGLDLKSYSNLTELKNYRSVWVSKGNFKEDLLDSDIQKFFYHPICQDSNQTKS